MVLEKVRTVMFDNVKELVAGRMKELCNKRDIWIISSVPYSPSSKGVTTNGTWAMLHGSGLPPRFWAKAMGTLMYMRNRTPTATNTPYELVYRINLDVEHIRTFGCVAKAGEGGEVKCTNRIWEMGQPNGERHQQKRQNGDIR